MKDMAHKYASEHEKTNLPFGMLCVNHHHLLGGKSASVFHVAACVELIILAFNILDDWQDQDHHRSPWMQDHAGQSLTVETAFLLLAMSKLNGFLGSQKNNLAFQLIVDRINRSVHGQFADIRNAPLKEEEYIAVIKQKSGALCALACLCGAMLAGNTTDLHLIGEYATGIGICAQLENDLDDVLHLGEKNDLIHKKWTLATMYLAHHPSRIGKAVASYFENRLSLDRLLAIQSLEAWIQSSGVILYTRVLIEAEKIKAKNIIDKLSVDETIKRQIKSFVDGIHFKADIPGET
ncbi:MULTISPECIES: polyprenyl synthetase family protein [Heyndrickxia]|jgi:competence protein ComQ|nr:MULTISPECIES: polyprenyl synthetase family protein [Heyndrickxia]MCR4443705.1 polyprenyl synthetase family protein [Heyndrickxia coagulans]MED4321614.1 polyprenyl synthetase family protein [Weizmannia sp. CD-2023]MED4868039.1 polyprenyl synthetase family protein [Weizmannia sp. CD-2023]MED4891487.1 polyprenyl synthetase family protein [Weizmannia sp. CD-2023]MED4922273.1 polyprenyl synthetase family protein [Weizmannia sp. CD-2023]